MKSSILRDITPCRPLKANWRFGGTCRLHLQDRSISRLRNQRESSCEKLKSFLLFLKFVSFLNNILANQRSTPRTPLSLQFVSAKWRQEWRYYGNVFVKFPTRFDRQAAWVMMLCCYLLMGAPRQLWQGGHVYEVDLPPEVTAATDCANLCANKQAKKYLYTFS
jgi:hypothetical protein